MNLDAFEKVLMAESMSGIFDMCSFINNYYYELLEDPDRFRPYFLSEPDWAFWFALLIDRKRTKETEKAVSSSDYYTARYYACVGEDLLESFFDRNRWDR